MNVVITESLQRTKGQLTPCLISMSLMQADCHKNRIVIKTQEAQEHKDEQSSNRPACPRKVPLPSESTTELFGCHNIFRKAVFPLWPIVIFVTCHNSLPPPSPPTPTPGVAHKLDPSLQRIPHSIFHPPSPLRSRLKRMKTMVRQVLLRQGSAHKRNSKRAVGKTIVRRVPCLAMIRR